MLKALAQRFQTRPLVATDRRLEALRAGHAAVIEEALAELSPKVRGWVYRRVGPDGAADDVAQEVLTEIAAVGSPVSERTREPCSNGTDGGKPGVK